MALPRLRRAQNVEGDLYVDASCIDCDTCRWMAPATFARRDGKSAVVQQPTAPGERRAALHALVSCPTASIGTLAPAPDLKVAQEDLPLPVRDGSGAVLPLVHHLGYHSADSFGATSYLLQHPDGNVLVDSPRFAAPLVRRIEAMGGARHLLLTHRDDVADHDRFAAHFGLTRVLHRDDAPVPGGPVERFLEGTQPTEILPGLTAIPVPGHTRGHVVYHWDHAGGVLLTGDHLAYDAGAHQLEAWPDVCWYSWEEQTRSMARLLEWDFAWVLPGHGRRGHMPAPRMREELARLVAWMERQG